MTTTRGVLHILSAPSPLCPHIEWAVGGVLGAPVSLAWHPQPAERATYRAEHAWTGPAGTAARLASALKRWPRLRFEVAEDAAGGATGDRYCCTPTLGVFHAATADNGDTLVPEDRLRQALLVHARDPRGLADAVEALLGSAWDAELDVFRQAADGDALRWLPQVGRVG